LRAGLPVFATPDAARSFNDDLEQIRQMGIQLVSEDEAARLGSQVERIDLCDFDFPAIASAFQAFGVSLSRLDLLAVAVFDHGDAPAHVSDRQFRFDYLDEHIRRHNRLSAFAFPAGQVPPIMTRLQAVVASAQGLDAPLMVMDTAPAAVLGALFDRAVSARPRKLIANVGNFHTLAFRLGPGGIEGVFEHHTGLIDRPRLEALLLALADSSLKHEDVFADHGHGALVYHARPMPLARRGFQIVVTGPRRSLLADSRLRPHFAAPFGDMMIAGCFGLLAAAADLYPAWGDEIRCSLTGASSSGAPPWEIEP
jgi:uncharacterized protein (DUF1786 family)